MPSESDKWGWQHVSVFGGFEKGSGTKRWKCNYCNMRYNGSYSRVRAHLLGLTGAGVKSCPAIDKSLRKAFQILEEDRLASRKKKTARAEKFAKYGSLATFNIDKSVIGDAYNWCFQSLEAVRTKGIDKDTVNQLKLLIENKWNDLFSPLQAAGYILNPKYFGRGQTKDRTAMQGWKAVIERYEAESSVRRLLREQLSAYWRLEGSLGEADAVESRDKMDPVAWWENFGFETPHLQALAIKVLSQVSSVTVCLESFLCNNMRSNEPAKSLCVEDLAFVQQNLRLQTLKFGNSRGINASKNSKLCDTSTVGSKDTLQLDDHALH